MFLIQGLYMYLKLDLKRNFCEHITGFTAVNA